KEDIKEIGGEMMFTSRVTDILKIEYPVVQAGMAGAITTPELVAAVSDQVRLDDIHEAFTNNEVKAIFCARGGYGSARLLPHIQYEVIRQNPKIFWGYSDITA
ncbi:LD-carboxypeptidase, partial [Bacillus sp. D-CC]